MDMTRNYFELFDLTPGFELDLGLLSEKYRELQKQWHPDRFAHLSERERRLSVQYTAHLNEAFQSLKSPLRRAQYLLLLQGRDTHGESGAQLDPMFLMEQMELRERLSEVAEQDDPEAELEQLQQEAEQALRELRAEFVSLYTGGDLDGAERTVRKMQFATKLESEIEALEDRLFDD
ncbi:Fe-S protein assembly co-chaperone HscB [Marinobacterium lutimaris]|uniref:Co-chaperone protein HscB homolog n=1 Tax=Marinobacterium lutimaris TaxID=568106 RepID=A0A1H6DMW6_9GAMM|nr:Fe-S protein assembly co-chaperone HscB [Marinobacterium lutimaris]SEG86564.1 Co-chaperone protein HscB [Marinobacterium lutimaris]